MSLFHSIDTFLGKALKVSIILVTLLVVGAMTLQVLIRYFLPLPLYGLDEFTGHSAVWLYMLGASYGAYSSNHIKADLLDLFKLPQRVQQYIQIAGNALCIIFSYFFISWSWNYVQWSIAKNEVTPSLHIPTVFFQVSIFLASLLLLLFFIKELVSNVAAIKTTGKEN